MGNKMIVYNQPIVDKDRKKKPTNNFLDRINSKPRRRGK